jgi:hypothetical protein
LAGEDKVGGPDFIISIVVVKGDFVTDAPAGGTTREEPLTFK